jgi:tetratricopeptide (TPR) repeat protein
LFVITGPATFSAAQNLTNELEKYTEAIFVGQPTGEAVNYWGDVKIEVMPHSKLNIALSWLWWQNMDPRDKRPFMPPHLAAGMSFENYRSGFDSALNLVLQFQEKQSVPEQLEQLIQAGKMDKALSVIRAYMTDPRHRFRTDELEETINNLAYSLLNKNKLQEAAQLFSANVFYYPHSANAYNSYAECFYRLGKNEEAIANYKTALALDPNGPIGADSKKMLALLKPE